MKRSGLISGALILSVGTVLAKVFSAIYRIVLTRILGGVGIGMYQLIFPLYSLCVVVVTAGLPLAVSKLVARYPNSAKKIVKKTIFFMTVVALLITILMLLIGRVSVTSEIYSCYFVLAPTLVVIASSAILKGYFQGVNYFTPSAISNIIEQFIKMVIGLVLAVSLISISLSASIIGAMLGIMISEIISLVVLIIYYKKVKIKDKDKINLTYREILQDIIPITVTNIILPFASFIDSIVVVKLLNNNFADKVSIFLYGLESGAVSSLVSIPTIFSFALASVLLPNIAKDSNVWNKNYNLSLSVKIVLTIVVPCVICFVFIPDRLMGLLYTDRLCDLGIDGTKIASALLSLSGIGMVALSINQIYSVSLQGVNERIVTIRNMIIAVVIKFVIELVFLPTIMLNIYSLAIANTVCYIVVLALNHAEVMKVFHLKINYTFGAKLLLANSLMVLAMIGILTFGNSIMNTLLAGLIGVIVYLGSVILLKMFNRNDYAMLKYSK
ncbi:MAG: oligosaccharide flippase family protein [Clostridia bacterium]